MMCAKGEGATKLSPCALGVTCGVIKGVSLLVIAWVAAFWGYGLPMVDHIAQFYHGYSASVVGGLIGGGYGLVAGYIFGFIFGFIYNFCLCCKCKKSDAS